ncbi:MAG TPA: alpha/beta hydrolase [Acidimicrobiales bacterium]|nr:alpha/beta hydrolase [Acidimicrobiales bacterium]
MSDLGHDAPPEAAGNRRHAWSRRKVLGLGLGIPIALAGGITGIELSRRQEDQGGILLGPPLSTFSGRCTTDPPYRRIGRGVTYTGQFFSRARNRQVGYTLAYPPGYVRGDVLPLLVYLHPYGGSHASLFGGYPLATALSLGHDGNTIHPMAMVCADGGDGYWHPRPGDDPMAMVVEELIPMCQRIGLGHSRPVLVTGIAMGGYGAILFAEEHPELFAAAAAISPSIWPDYHAARKADPSAFTSRAQFDRYDVIRHAGALAGKPLRVVQHTGDAFARGVADFARACPRPADVAVLSGPAGTAFFTEQAWPTLRFLSELVPAAAPRLPAYLSCTHGSA